MADNKKPNKPSTEIQTGDITQSRYYDKIKSIDPTLSSVPRMYGDPNSIINQNLLKKWMDEKESESSIVSLQKSLFSHPLPGIRQDKKTIDDYAFSIDEAKQQEIAAQAAQESFEKERKENQSNITSLSGAKRSAEQSLHKSKLEKSEIAKKHRSVTKEAERFAFSRVGSDPKVTYMHGDEMEEIGLSDAATRLFQDEVATKEITDKEGNTTLKREKEWEDLDQKTKAEYIRRSYSERTMEGGLSNDLLKEAKKEEEHKREAYKEVGQNLQSAFEKRESIGIKLQDTQEKITEAREKRGPVEKLVKQIESEKDRYIQRRGDTEWSQGRSEETEKERAEREQIRQEREVEHTQNKHRNLSSTLTTDALRGGIESGMMRSKEFEEFKAGEFVQKHGGSKEEEVQYKELNKEFYELTSLVRDLHASMSEMKVGTEEYTEAQDKLNDASDKAKKNLGEQMKFEEKLKMGSKEGGDSLQDTMRAIGKVTNALGGFVNQVLGTVINSNNKDEERRSLAIGMATERFDMARAAPYDAKSLLALQGKDIGMTTENIADNYNITNFGDEGTIGGVRNSDKFLADLKATGGTAANTGVTYSNNITTAEAIQAAGGVAGAALEGVNAAAKGGLWAAGAPMVTQGIESTLNAASSNNLSSTMAMGGINKLFGRGGEERRIEKEEALKSLDESARLNSKFPSMLTQINKERERVLSGEDEAPENRALDAVRGVAEGIKGLSSSMVNPYKNQQMVNAAQNTKDTVNKQLGNISGASEMLQTVMDAQPAYSSYYRSSKVSTADKLKMEKEEQAIGSGGLDKYGLGVSESMQLRGRAIETLGSVRNKDGSIDTSATAKKSIEAAKFMQSADLQGFMSKENQLDAMAGMRNSGSKDPQKDLAEMFATKLTDRREFKQLVEASISTSQSTGAFQGTLSMLKAALPSGGTENDPRAVINAKTATEDYVEQSKSFTVKAMVASKMDGEIEKSDLSEKNKERARLMLVNMKADQVSQYADKEKGVESLQKDYSFSKEEAIEFQKLMPKQEKFTAEAIDTQNSWASGGTSVAKSMNEWINMSEEEKKKLTPEQKAEYKKDHAVNYQASGREAGQGGANAMFNLIEGKIGGREPDKKGKGVNTQAPTDRTLAETQSVANAQNQWNDMGKIVSEINKKLPNAFAALSASIMATSETVKKSSDTMMNAAKTQANTNDIRIDTKALDAAAAKITEATNGLLNYLNNSSAKTVNISAGEVNLTNNKGTSGVAPKDIPPQNGVKRP
jgi:hypothetical protein